MGIVTTIYHWFRGAVDDSDSHQSEVQTESNAPAQLVEYLYCDENG